LSDKVTTTPLLVQDGFGYGGAELPGDGLTYCGPTAAAMSLLWLGKNGWNQIGPAAPTQSDALALDLLLAGLADTSALGGTNADNLQKAVVTLYGASFVKGSAVQRMFLSFVSFFVRSESPFLRPDPQQRQAVARRSCQGWPSRQPCGMLRACQAIP
jgi:hypothetical protein